MLYFNRSFLSNLPDKGAKINNLIARIEHALHEKENVDDASELFENLAIKAENSSRAQNNQQDSGMLETLVNKNQREVTVIDESHSGSGSEYVNIYDKIIKRARENQPKKDKYFAHRTVKHSELDNELVSSLKQAPEKNKSKNKSTKSRLEPLPENSSPLLKEDSISSSSARYFF